MVAYEATYKSGEVKALVRELKYIICLYNHLFDQCCKYPVQLKLKKAFCMF